MHSLFSLSKSSATKEDGTEVCGLSVNENMLWSLQESLHAISSFFSSLSKVLECSVFLMLCPLFMIMLKTLHTFSGLCCKGVSQVSFKCLQRITCYGSFSKITRFFL